MCLRACVHVCVRVGGSTWGYVRMCVSGGESFWGPCRLVCGRALAVVLAHICRRIACANVWAQILAPIIESCVLVGGSTSEAFISDGLPRGEEIPHVRVLVADANGHAWVQTCSCIVLMSHPIRKPAMPADSRLTREQHVLELSGV